MTKKKKDAKSDKITDAIKSSTKVKPLESSADAASGNEAPTPPQSTEQNVIASEKSVFPVVGIGASAGGLEAFEKFFSQMPPENGLAFVVIVHLDPKHTSILPELIQKKTKMKVSAIKDGVKVTPGHVYIIPPNKDVLMMNGTLQLLEPVETAGLRLPIDFFLRSLAEDRGDQTVAIILSGTGSDGASGIKSIKEGGGLVMVQDEDSAAYNGMPRSAIATGVADSVLPPDQMPEKLIQYLKTSVRLGERMVSTPEAKTLDELPKIFGLLRTKTGHDFSLYKKNTILRRLERRMSLNQIEKISSYVRYLRQNGEEIDALFREILIGVTNFFRDPEAFEVLKTKIIPELLAKSKPDQTVRVWVLGCSTGEEAYSMAILLRECLDEQHKETNFQVFGTDIDSQAIEKAREGTFPHSIAADVNPERLKRFFIKEENAYRIKKEIRDSMVFAVQDVTKDAPFSKLDLLCCRNLLIYMESELQKKLLPLFHYTIKEGGILFLGSSESIGGFSDLFSVADKKWKIYRRKPQDHAVRATLDFPTGPKTDQVGFYGVGAHEPARRELDIGEKARAIVLERFSPTSVLIDSKGNIKHIQGRTGKYLELVSGQPNLNLLMIAREGLRLELNSAVRKAVATKETIVLEGLQVRTNGDVQPITLTVMPLGDVAEMSNLMMVVFQDTPPPCKDVKIPVGKGDSQHLHKRIPELERELQYTRESHQTTVEELETSNEELKSMNEEMQSGNEELQSTNEELEASKEELQSLNEELQTVNSELQSKIDELSQVHDDMKNLLNSTQIATIFLDNDLNVVRFTPHAKKIVNLIETDIGRPISHIVSELEHPELTNEIKGVINTLVFKEKEVKTKDGKWYQMRIMPYRTGENVIDGVVITFVEISGQKVIQEQLQESLDFSQSIVDTVREPLLVLDKHLQVITVSQSFYNIFKANVDSTVGQHIYHLGNNQWDIPKLRILLEKVVSEDARLKDFEVEHMFPEIGFKKMLLNASRIPKKKDNEYLILLAMEDVTGKNEFEEQ